MASASGASSGSPCRPTNSSSEEDPQAVMEQKKRKRMLSNRESARRSRMRKQKRLDDLMGQVSNLRKENNQILNTLNHTTNYYLGLEAENSVLRTQILELTSRLNSLQDILQQMNLNSTSTSDDLQMLSYDYLINTWSSLLMNQPIMASPDVLHYY